MAAEQVARHVTTGYRPFLFSRYPGFLPPQPFNCPWHRTMPHEVVAHTSKCLFVHVYASAIAATYICKCKFRGLKGRYLRRAALSETMPPPPPKSGHDRHTLRAASPDEGLGLTRDIRLDIRYAWHLLSMDPDLRETSDSIVELGKHSVPQPY